MRTSTKLLSGALLILLAMIMIYNLQLRSVYLSGKYKKLDHKEIDIKDFDEIEINGANLIHVQFKQGPYNIRVQNNLRDSVIFSKTGNRLIVSLDENENLIKSEAKTEISSNGTTMTTNTTTAIHPRDALFVTITCPQIKLIKTTDDFLVKDKALSVQDYKKAVYYYQLYVELTNFTLNDLSIIQQSQCSVVLNFNNIKNLTASTGKRSIVDIEKTNTIQKANLQINGGTLILDNIIPDLTYHIADSAKITLTGNGLKNFGKH